MWHRQAGRQAGRQGSQAKAELVHVQYRRINDERFSDAYPQAFWFPGPIFDSPEKDIDTAIQYAGGWVCVPCEIDAHAGIRHTSYTYV